MKHALLIAAALFASAVGATETGQSISANAMSAPVVSPVISPVISPTFTNAAGAGPAQNVNLDQRNIALGLAASVSAATCYGSILGGLAVWTSAPCVRHFKMLQFLGMQNFDAAHEFLCQDEDQRAAILAAGQRCRGEAPGARGPVFQTGAEAEGGYGPYKPYRN